MLLIIPVGDAGGERERTEEKLKAMTRGDELLQRDARISSPATLSPAFLVALRGHLIAGTRLTFHTLHLLCFWFSLCMHPVKTVSCLFHGLLSQKKAAKRDAE